MASYPRRLDSFNKTYRKVHCGLAYGAGPTFTATQRAWTMDSIPAGGSGNNHHGYAMLMSTFVVTSFDTRLLVPTAVCTAPTVRVHQLLTLAWSQNKHSRTTGENIKILVTYTSFSRWRNNPIKTADKTWIVHYWQCYTSCRGSVPSNCRSDQELTNKLIIFFSQWRNSP
jgi:hypothetical protein